MSKPESMVGEDLLTLYNDDGKLVSHGRMPYLSAQQSLMQYNVARMASGDPINSAAKIICLAVCSLKESVDCGALEPPLTSAMKEAVNNLAEVLSADPFYDNGRWLESNNAETYAKLVDVSPLLIHAVVDHGNTNRLKFGYVDKEILA